MLGAMGLGAVVAKALLLGNHQVRRADIIRISPVAAGMLILEVDFLHEADYLYNNQTLLALHNPLLIISALAIVLGSVAVWVKLREGVRVKQTL